MGGRPLADPAASPAKHLMKALSQKDKKESKFFCGLRNAVNGHSRELNTEELKVVEATWGVLSDAVEGREQRAGAVGGIAGLRPPPPSAASVETTWGISSDAVEGEEQEAAASGSTTGLRLQSLHAAGEPGDERRREAEPKAATSRVPHLFSRDTIRVLRLAFVAGVFQANPVFLGAERI